MSDQFTLSSMAFRNLRRRPLRTGILVAALSLMVAALVFALSFVTRVNSSIKLTSDRLGADLLIVPTGARGAAEDILVENRATSFYMNKSFLDRIKKIDGIDKVSATRPIWSRSPASAVPCRRPWSLLLIRRPTLL